MLFRSIQKHDRKVVDIDLVQVQRKENLQKTKLRDADLNSFAEAVEFQKAHKYKFMWVIRYCIQKDIEIPAKYRGLLQFVR